MVPARLYPGNQNDSCGSANCPIFLSNDTDSGISLVEQSTPVKVLGAKCQLQHLTSTPKLKLKLLVAAQQHINKLVAKRQGAPHKV